MMYNWFPVPIQCSIIQDFDQQKLISSLNFSKTEDPSYFGDSKNIDQIHNKEVFSFLNKSIKENVKQYLNSLGCADQLNISVQKSWAVVLSKGGYVKKHNHPNSHLSCIFYLKVSDSVIKFYRDDNHPLNNLPVKYNIDTIFNHQYGAFKPVDGMLLVFPSSLYHEVEVYEDTNERYSISYDIMLSYDTPQENVMLTPSKWKIL